MFPLFSSSHHLHKSCCPRFSSLISRILFHQNKSHLRTAADTKNPKTPPSSVEANPEYLSSLKFLGIARTVISKCSNLWCSNKGETFNTASLKDHLLSLSSICPHIVRRFWRTTVLKPEHVLEIFLGFKSDRCENKLAVQKSVGTLWGIFNWASGQSKEFLHSPHSCKIMASLLVHNGYFTEAEYLFTRKESQGILLDCKEIFDNLIVGYLGEFDLEKGLLVYERMRSLDLVPSLSTYDALLGYLVELNETKLMYDVYLDLITVGMGRNVEESSCHEKIIRLLCADGKVQEARDLVRRTMSFGMKPSNLVVNAISSGYCDKKDYSDLLIFLDEAGIVPDMKLGNKILFSLCNNFGTDQASVFLQKLEEINFSPSEITFGILIGFSCREGKLKNALCYISDVLSRGLKPNVYSYNALLSGMFKEGMWMQAREVLLDMKDMGVSPDLSTYRVLLAGFCKARQFDEVKAIVSEMVDCDLITLTPLEDLLAKGFVILGLSPSNVKIKRDNDRGLYKTEFFDSLGNGLYLDTDMDEYEKIIVSVLEDAMVPDFNSSIVDKSSSSDIQGIEIMVDEMEIWGQELSSSASACLINRFCSGPFSVKNITHHVSVMSKSIYQLDHKNLNTLIRMYSKNGFAFNARMLFDGMVKRGYTIDNRTYSSLLFDACKKGDLKSFSYCCDLAQKSNWYPEAKDRNALLRSLCRNKWLNEACELFETMLSVSPYDIMGSFHSLLEGLCTEGLTSIARPLVEEFSKEGMFLDNTAYSHLVSGFCREKKFVEALRTFDYMLSLNLSPPQDVVMQVICQLCKTNVEKAFELKILVSRNQPHALILINCALINGLCKSGKIEKAASVFREVSLEGSIFDVEVYNSLIEGYCVLSNFEKVKQILAAMIRNNFSITVFSYSKMVRSACTEDKFSIAICLKELMVHTSELPQLVLYNILIFHISSMRAHLLLDEIIFTLGKKDIQFDDVTYNYVIRGFLLCEDTSRCLHYLTAMISQGLKPSNRTLRKVITRLCENGNIDLIVDLSRQMEIRGWDFGPFIQCKIVNALIDNRNILEAVEFLDKLMSKDLISNNMSYDYLIQRFYQHGRMDKSVELLNSMLRKGSAPESTSYDCIIQGLCDCCEWDKALDYYTEMLCRGLKPSLSTFETLVCGLTGCGLLEEGEKILKSMICYFGENPRREVFETLVGAYISEKNNSKAFELLKFMQQKGYEPDFDTHWSLIGNLSDSSKMDQKSGFLSGLLSGFGVARKKNSSDVR
ncbi:Pentatricopeptide repeat-containing protein [Striga hermonthica]|uniref:Pentatricopeptide repeat-containing protein n=1 Tax=Striga hermonthica TaxID=68872 RepID=A0A9N7MZD5_STRHE|nr:Pentatricopeptide repeat-containing protein [Striga hermonthica]